MESPSLGKEKKVKYERNVFELEKLKKRTIEYHN